MKTRQKFDETGMASGQGAGTPIRGRQPQPQLVASTNLPSNAVATVTFAEFRKYMATEMEGMKTKVIDEIAVSIKDVTDRVKVNTDNIQDVLGQLKEIKSAVAPENLRRGTVSYTHLTLPTIYSV